MNEMIDGLSMNIEQTNMDKLQSVFPECFAEGKLDIDKLLSLCGEYIDNDFEKYKFEWKGKAECLRLAQKRSTGTLRPCPEESVNWDTTKNLYIEGDNLEVLKLLQTAYYRRVKMIYIDPPYNTGNDFVYEDDFADPLARYKEVTQQTTKSNPETMGRYHTNWLNMMYPRLRLAANLLRDDGVIFISIDDNEVDNLKKLCNEVFGEENFIGSIAWESKTKSQNTKDAFNKLQPKIEYILVYTKANLRRFNLLAKGKKEYNLLDEKGKYREHTQEFMNAGSIRGRETMIYTIDGISPPPGKQWQIGIDTIMEYKNRGDLIIRNGKVILKMRPGDERIEITEPFWAFFSKEIGTTESAKKELNAIQMRNIFDTVKPLKLIKRLIFHSTTQDSNDIILDFFSGSATTAHAVMQLNAEDGGNRQFIMVQLPEVCDQKSEAYKAGYQNICEIGKERIRRAGKNIAETIYKEKFAIKINEQQVDSFAQSCEMLKPREDSIQDELKNVDIGFKVFKLDSSNLKTWDNTPVTAEQMDLLYERMNHMIHRVKADRSDLDMVCEIMLKLGIPLTYSITAVEINGKTAYSIGDDCLLLICLAPDVQPEDVEQMAEYAPAKLIVSRESFVDDTAMANAHYILKDHGVELKLV